MSVNLLNLFSDTISSELSAKASRFLGESTANTDTGLITILPAILGGLMQIGSTVEGASSIQSFMEKESIDGTMLDDLSQHLDGGKNTHKLLDHGDQILGFIFPDKTQVKSIVNMLNSRASLGQSSSSSLLKMTAPLFMEMLSKHIQKNTLDDTALSNLLEEQKGYLKLAAPSGLLDKLGLSSLTDGVKGAVQRSTTAPLPTTPVVTKIQEKEKSETTEDPQEVAPEADTNSAASRLGPWVMLFILAGAMFYFMKSCGGRPGPDPIIVENPESIDSTSADSLKKLEIKDYPLEIPIGSSIRQINGDSALIILPNGAQLKTATGSLIDKTYTYLTSGQKGSVSFTFVELVFRDETSTIMNNSFGAIRDAGKVLRAYPKATIIIDSFYDLAEQPAQNLKISQQRALAVKMALVDLGLDGQRIQTNGYGQAAANAPEVQDSLTNNRIDFRIIAN